MNPLFNMLMGNQSGMPQMQPTQPPQMPMANTPVPMANTPVSTANAIYQAMINPAAFVKQAIPDLPPQIANDPNQILQYLQQTGRVTPQQIQQVANSIPRF